MTERIQTLLASAVAALVIVAAAKTLIIRPGACADGPEAFIYVVEVERPSASNAGVKGKDRKPVTIVRESPRRGWAARHLRKRLGGGENSLLNIFNSHGVCTRGA